MDRAEKNALADRLFGAIERGDIEAVRACYAPAVKVWHNFDQKEQTRDESIAPLKWVCDVIHDRHYDITRREELPDGIMQLHVLRGTVTRTGAPYALPAAIVITMAAADDGAQVTRIDEYLDRAGAPG